VAERGEIGITAAVDCILGTSLYTGVAFPAHTGLDVVSTARGFIDVHDVRRTDIDAMATTITASHINECRHVIALPPVGETNDSIFENQLMV